jgi:hypothetical protein
VEINWDEMAKARAIDCHENQFSSRLGTEKIRGQQAAYHFNNNPYCDNVLARERELELATAEISKIGIEKIGYAEFPLSGEDDGYSYVVIFRCTGKQVKTIDEVFRKYFASEL